MNKTRIAKLASVSAGALAALSFATTAGAQTSAATLQAQINALMAQLSAMQGTSSYTFTVNLTVGSRGADVVALQSMLESKGYLVMPVGVAKGYFGGLTRAAVARWQAASGIAPAAGYFGPISRAAANAMVVVGGTTTGGTTTGGSSSAGITTPGKEGTMTVTTAPVTNSTLYEGSNMQEILSFKVKATGSDLAVQRVKVDLGTVTDLYRDVLSKIYLVDDSGKTLASADLNSSTVVRNADDEYELTLSGFSSIVSKDATRTYSLKADVQDNIDSADLIAFTTTLSENGVRAIDGAGIDLYSPTADTTVSKAITYAATLVDSATLTVSTNSSNPLSKDVVAAGGSGENEADKVVLLTFDIRAEKDSILVTDLKNFVLSSTGGTAATASTTYLYKGNCASGITSSCTLLGTAAVSTTDADFLDIDHTIAAGTTQTYTLAVDVRSANTVATTFSASFTGNNTNVVAENSKGDTLGSSLISGSATSNSVVVRNIGATFALVGSPVMTRQTVSSNDTSGIATSTGVATYTVRVTAVGGNVVLGSTASSTTIHGDNGSATTSTTWLAVYKNGASVGALSGQTAAGTNAILSYSVPSSGVTTSGETFTLAEGNSVDIPVTVQFTVSGSSTNTYAVQINGFRWFNSTTGYQNTTSMTNKSEWRTNAISLP